MKLTLVRHGRPDEGHRERPHDPPLREDGRRQAEAVAALLAEEAVTAVVASPMQRAQDTARPLAERLGLAVRTVEGWAETDRHVEHYRSTETLRSLGDAEWQRFLDDPVRYLGGDPQAFRQTVVHTLRATAEGDDGAHVVVFTHGLPINIALSFVLGLEKIVHFRPGYGSVTRLIARSGRFGVVSVNDSAHCRLPCPGS